MLESNEISKMLNKYVHG